MKKIILIISIVFLIFTLMNGCTNESQETPKPSLSASPSVMPSATPTPTVPPEPEELKDPDIVHLVECQFYGDSMQNLDYKEAWPSIIEDHYGVEITMAHPARNNYMETIQQSAMSGDLTGIVELFGGSYLEEWQAEGLIYPLSDFLKYNEVWNTIIPEYWKDEYTINGEVWAVPTGNDGTISWLPRSMRGDWLDKFGLSKPYTIDEFYNASMKFTYDDPDGNNINDTVGFTAIDASNLQDIFSAFDARLAFNGETLSVLNPNNNTWENSMLKPEMAECLDFLRDCFSNGILDPDCFGGISGSVLKEKMSSGFYGGTQYWDSWFLSFERSTKELIPDAYLVCVGALSHTIEKNLTPYVVSTGGSPRVLMKSTPQPRETINWYINTFFGDEWGFWTGRLGPVGQYRGQEGFACTIEGNTIVRNTFIDDAGAVKTFPGPGYIGGLPAKALYSVYEIEYHVPSPPEGYETWAADTASRAKENTLKRNAWIDEYIENGMAYQVLSESTQRFDFNNELNKAGLNAIKDAITGETSVSAALAEYKEIAKTLGVQIP